MRSSGIVLAAIRGRRGRTLIRTRKRQCRWASGWTAPLQLFRRLFRDNLQVKERTNRMSVDSIQHLLEQVKTLFLILYQWVLLAITHQTDALFQVVDRQQVIFPLSVDDVE